VSTNLQPDRQTLLTALDARGFKYVDDVIHVFAGGSNQHGAKGEGSGDLDICGVYIEPADVALGIDREEHFVFSTGNNESRNTAADVDFSMYSLRKWVNLAAKGNPTVLSYLFMPYTVAGGWFWIREDKELFLAASHVKAFAGFGRSQLQRMQGLKGAGKHGQRDEIISEHGYDTKAAMHMVRMMLECKELLLTGKMTFPNPSVGLLIAIRKGEFRQRQVEEMYITLEQEIFEIEDKKQSVLPPAVDRQAISKLVSRVYLEHWNA
jgi:uncharacterized protein